MKKPDIHHISVYAKPNDKIIFIPTGTDEIGLGRQINHPVIQTDYGNAELIGKNCKAQLQYAKEHPFVQSTDSVNVALQETRAKNSKEIVKEWICISVVVCYEEVNKNRKYGFNITTLKAQKNGGYLGEVGYPAYHLPMTASDRELGNAIFRAIEAANEIA